MLWWKRQREWTVCLITKYEEIRKIFNSLKVCCIADCFDLCHLLNYSFLYWLNLTMLCFPSLTMYVFNWVRFLWMWAEFALVSTSAFWISSLRQVTPHGCPLDIYAFPHLLGVALCNHSPNCLCRQTVDNCSVVSKCWCGCIWGCQVVRVPVSIVHVLEWSFCEWASDHCLKCWWSGGFSSQRFLIWLGVHLWVLLD